MKYLSPIADAMVLSSMWIACGMVGTPGCLVGAAILSFMAVFFCGFLSISGEDE